MPKRKITYVPDAPEPPAEPDERTKALQAKIERLIKHRERAKKEYSKAGTVLNELIRDMQVNEIVVLPDGRQAKLVDAFETRNFCYRQTSFTRCDVEVTG
jgi:hypothetical protein